MKKILDSIRERLDGFSEAVAQAISDSDWITLVKCAGIALLAVLCALALIVAIVALVGKIFGSLLMKILTVPMVLFILAVSYEMNRKDSQVQRLVENESIALDKWAEEMYGYVRDALFLVIRAVSEYTNIIPPARASAIEFTDNPYSVEDGYVVFNFLAKVCGKIDCSQLKSDIQTTMQQMQRAHELNGIPRDLVEVNGSYYCPLQILGEPRDYGDYVHVSVVFATEKTVALTHAHRLLNLDNVGHTRKKWGEQLTDDEL